MNSGHNKVIFSLPYQKLDLDYNVTGWYFLTGFELKREITPLKGWSQTFPFSI